MSQQKQQTGGKRQMLRRLRQIPGLIVRAMKWAARRAASVVIFGVCRCFPLQDKVVGSNFSGKRYGDNTKAIFEELMKIPPEQIKLVWRGQRNFAYEMPPRVKRVDTWNVLRFAYEYATAKVWIDTHVLPSFIRKRKGQLYIETWHGGLGIKKIFRDAEKQPRYHKGVASIKHMNRLVDLYISNSDHLSNVYRSAMGYHGPIWKVGYPKNDVIIQNDHLKYADLVRQTCGISDGTKIMLYAPSFRDCFEYGKVNTDPYGIDFAALHAVLTEQTDEPWVILLRWHPVMQLAMKDYTTANTDNVVDVTDYPDIQELILAADAFISDYSSCIFDAAMRDIPCFTYVTDFEEYKKDRGVYYEMEELPFPYATNNCELLENIRTFDRDAYLLRWEAFKKRTGLHETGHAASDIAYVIQEYIQGNTKPVDDIIGAR